MIQITLTPDVENYITSVDAIQSIISDMAMMSIQTPEVKDGLRDVVTHLEAASDAIEELIKSDMYALLLEQREKSFAKLKIER